MTDIPFFRTGMGQKFYEGTMPKLVEQLEKLNENLIAIRDHDRDRASIDLEKHQDCVMEWTPHEVRESLRIVVDMYFDDEAKDAGWSYETRDYRVGVEALSDYERERRDNHVFRHLLVLANWLADSAIRRCRSKESNDGKQEA
jgi:hypothetical protein